MKAHEFRHFRGTASRQRLALYLLLPLLLLGAAPVLPQSNPALRDTNIDLVCPCSIEVVGAGNARLKASIRNYDSVASGELYLQLWFSYYNPDAQDSPGGFTSFSLEHPPVAAGETAKVNALIQFDTSPSVSSIYGLGMHELAGDGGHYGKGDVTFHPFGDKGVSGTITNIDYIADKDKDGVIDHNEHLMKTSPDDADDKPGTVTLDIMGVYLANLKERTGMEPVECMAHSLEWANMALKNSGIDARFRLVKTRGLERGVLPVNAYVRDAWGYVRCMRTSQVLTGCHNEGLFDSISADRFAAGADLLVLFDSGGGGSAVVPRLSAIEAGYPQEVANIMSQAVCGSGGVSVLAHELGHNLGLRHSARQGHAHDGAFRWSRGHGEEGDFATVMAYPTAYDTDLRVQYFSNPKLNLCGSSKSRPCGVERDEVLAADAARSIRAVMYRAAQWVSDPPDDDGDGVVNFFDAFDDDSTETTDTDGDMIGDNADMDDDNDGLTDAEEKTRGTDPKDGDTDNDGVSDSVDLFPTDKTRSGGVDRDGDGVDAILDANDNDASVRWTRTNVTLTPDATVRANLIATFDDTTEGPAAIRANTAKYEVTGMFADPTFANWNLLDGTYGAARVGAASATTDLPSPDMPGGTGYIKIKSVTIIGDYISFLMTGGDGEADVGIRLLAAGTSELLADWKPDNFCFLTLQGDPNWRHINVSALTGQSIDIEIYDNSTNDCGFSIFDHFYQSDYPRGELVGIAIAPPDMDGDGLSDAQEVMLGTDPNRADTDGDGVGDYRDVEPNNAAVAYEADKPGTLHDDGKDARNVIADFDDIGVMRLNTRKYTLTGVFARPDITDWNRFEVEDREAAANRASGN